MYIQLNQKRLSLKNLKFKLQNTRNCMSHHTQEWTYNFQPVIYAVRGGIFC